MLKLSGALEINVELASHDIRGTRNIGKIQGCPEILYLQTFQEKLGIESIRGYPGIPKNHDIRTKRDIRTKSVTPRRSRIIRQSREAAHVKKSGVPRNSRTS